MSFFNFGKKEEPKKKEEKKVEKVITPQEDFLVQCQKNSNAILKKLEAKRFEILRQNPDLADIINAKVDIMVNYMKNVNWEAVIDDTWKNTQDREVCRICLNLVWQSLKEDLNRIIGEISVLIKEK